MVFTYSKVAFQTLLLCGNFLFGISPFLILKIFSKYNSESSGRNKYPALLVYFGGGVFMSICFLILNPKANEEYEKYTHSLAFKERRFVNDTDENDPKVHKDFIPIPELIMMFGFFLMFSIKELVPCIFKNFRTKQLDKSQRIPFCSCAKLHIERSITFEADTEESQSLLNTEKFKAEFKNSDDFAEDFAPERNEAIVDNKALDSAQISQAKQNYGTMTKSAHVNENQNNPVTVPPCEFEKDKHFVIMDSQTNIAANIPSITYALLVLTLFIYNISQGMSLGKLQETCSWRYFSQCAEQFVISFAIGSVFSQEIKATYTMICLIGFLSIMAPLGISITTIFESAMTQVTYVTISTVNSLLCGSLLYLTFFELLRLDITQNASSVGKFASFVFGFMLVAGLEYRSRIT